MAILKKDIKSGLNYFEDYIEINELKQYILVYPYLENDIALIHVHGGPGEADSIYTPFVLPETLKATLVYYDQRGAGKTQLLNKSTPDNITLEKIIEDLHELIKWVKVELNKKKVVLVGHSYGTVICHDFIKKYPTETVGYIAVGAVVSLIKGEKLNMDELSTIVEQKGLEEHKSIIKTLKEDNYPFIEDQEKFYSDFLKLRKIFWTYRPTYSNKFSKFKLIFKGYVARFKDRKWIGNVKLQFANNVNNLQSLIKYNIEDDLNYPIPTYFISGEKDYICPTSLVISYYKKIKAPKTEMFTIPYAAHVPQVDNTKEYWNVIWAIMFNIFNTPIVAKKSKE